MRVPATRTAALSVVGVAAALVAVCLLSLYAALPTSPRVARIVFLDVRVPRLLVGLGAGAALGVAGLLVQRALRNPLAVPELLGVSGGAALASAIVVVGDIGSAYARPAVAAVGALMGGGTCLAVAARGRTPTQTLLMGAAVSTALQGAVLAVIASGDQIQVAVLYRYLVGSLAEITRDNVAPMLVPLAAVLVLTPVVLPGLGVLSLGDDAARSLGVDPTRWRVGVLLLAAALVAVVVAPCGPLAWVSFLAPTLSRALWPRLDERWRLLAVALLGATLTGGADVLAREAFRPFETPVGAWTALVGLVVAVAVLLGRRGAA